MANTLSLGSGNWGAKDSLLLGYYENGKKFFPETFDVTRATGGTRVNKDGLIETPAEIGSELITNGNFATDSDWGKGAGWTISGGKASVDNASSTPLSQASVGVISGKTYKISFEISDFVSGRLQFQLGVSQVVKSVTANGVYELTTTSTVTNDAIYLYAVGASEFSIDNVSVVEYNDKNLARIDYLDDAKGALLTEPQSTNFITHSSDFSNSSWNVFRGSVTTNVTTSPDGTLNASRYQEDSQTGSHLFRRQSLSLTNGLSYTGSIFAKKGELTSITLQSNSSSRWVASAIFDLENGVVTSGNGVIEDYGNGWYKCSISGNAVQTTVDAGLEIYTSVGAGRDGDGLFMYGAMFEQQPYATSYIPTDGSTVTRNQDEVNNGGDVNSFGSEGVLYFEFKPNSIDTSTINISDSSTSNFIQLYVQNGGNNVRYRVTSAGVTQFDSNIPTAVDLTQNNKYAVKLEANNFALWLNGIEIHSQLTGSTPIGLNSLDFYSVFSAGQKVNGKTKNIQVFNTALSDSDLLSLTTTGSVPYWKQYSAMATSLNYTNK